MQQSQKSGNLILDFIKAKGRSIIRITGDQVGGGRKIGREEEKKEVKVNGKEEET